MPMPLDRITLTSFRNHSETALDGTRRFNLIIGENGAGKTNILEALSLLSPGRGMRRAALSDMIMANGTGGFAIGATLSGNTGDDTVRLGTYVEPAQPTRRLVRVNGAASAAIRLGEWLSVGWLTPAMDRLFTDTASARRRFLDRLTFALDPSHAPHASRYDAALRERNRMLADDAPPDPAWLGGVEAHMAEHGAAITAARGTTLAALADTLAQLPDAPFARPQLTLTSGGPGDRAALEAALEASRRPDRAARRTLVGPHRDTLDVSMASKRQPARLCSTGEQKAMLIAIILAHAQLAARGRPSLLLLDEVAAHLDPIRRGALFDRLQDSGAQVWMTGTDMGAFADVPDGAACWHVKNGVLERF